MPLNEELIASLLNIPTPNIHNQVLAKTRECVDRLNEVLPNVEIKIPTIVYDLKGTTAGQATSRNVMRLNLPALNDEELRPHMINQVVPHEMAHIAEYQLYGKAGHGYRWGMLCQLLGIKPERTHSLPLKRARKTTKFKYSCRCQNHWLGKNRHNKIQAGRTNFRCKYCKETLVYTGEQMERS